jgi:hypothetical protein
MGSAAYAKDARPAAKRSRPISPRRSAGTATRRRAKVPMPLLDLAYPDRGDL